MSDTGGLFPFDDAEEFAEDIVDEEEEYTIKDFEIDWDNSVNELHEEKTVGIAVSTS